MADITIHDVDPDTLERWRIRAGRNGRTVEAEIRAVLESEPKAMSREAFWEWADAVAAMTPKNHPSDSVSLLREDRDR